jgi:Dyp-type peroxidase family
MLETLFPSKLSRQGLTDIQAMVVRFYRLDYAKYYFLRFDNAEQGRAWIGRIGPCVTSANEWDEQGNDLEFTWNVGLTYPGLQTLGLPDESLRSFAAEFREGMTARATFLGDTGPSAPEHWDAGLGTDPSAVHALLVLYARDPDVRAREDAWLRGILADLPGVRIGFEQEAALLPTGREHFGYRDGIGQPATENSGAAPLPGQTHIVRTGEFVLGYPDETGDLPPAPTPDILGRHGSYLALRKLAQDVAAFRAFVTEQAAALGVDDEFMAAKLMGRWRSGAPLVLAPEQDDPVLGADSQRNNDFGFLESDPAGFACPHASHIRRGYSRDQKPEKIGGQQRHRILRVGMPYGAGLPEGAPDDGADRGLVFVFIGASIERQFEFVQTAWMNDGDFLQHGTDRDPISGANDGTTNVVLPWKPIRYRIKGIPRFVTTRGGGYFFMPSLTALGWLARAEGE